MAVRRLVGLVLSPAEGAGEGGEGVVAVPQVAGVGIGARRRAGAGPRPAGRGRVRRCRCGSTPGRAVAPSRRAAGPVGAGRGRRRRNRRAAATSPTAAAVAMEARPVPGFLREQRPGLGVAERVVAAVESGSRAGGVVGRAAGADRLAVLVGIAGVLLHHRPDGGRSAGQLAKPYWRATTSWASASAKVSGAPTVPGRGWSPDGVEGGFSPARTWRWRVRAWPLRCSRLGRLGRQRMGTTASVPRCACCPPGQAGRSAVWRSCRDARAAQVGCALSADRLRPARPSRVPPSRTRPGAVASASCSPTHRRYRATERGRGRPAGRPLLGKAMTQ